MQRDPDRAGASVPDSGLGAPVVVILAPASGSVVSVGLPTVIRAVATDGVGVAAPGATTSVVITWFAPYLTYVNGFVSVDPEDAVAETNEDNNISAPLC